MKKLLCGLMITLSAFAQAQSLDLVVPFAPGGGADVFGRAVQKYYKKITNEDMIVSNRPGAGGVVGAQHVLKQTDGKTLLVGNAGSLVFNKILFNNQSYDYNDFEMVGPYAVTPSVLTVSDTSITKPAQFVELAKRKPITCGASSPSGVIAGRALLKQLQINNAEIIIYRGSSEIVTALLGRHIDCSIDTFSSHMPIWKDKKINIIAVGSESAHPDLPGVPMFQDIVPGLVFNLWFGIAIPKTVDSGMRRTVLSKFTNLHRDPEFRQTMNAQGLEAVVGNKNPNQWLDQQYQKFEQLRIEAGVNKQ
jgi:tripartite-type tricarboxylate transporter receptor subunit TctC